MAPTSDSPTPLVGTDVIARRLGTTERYVRDLAASGRIPHFKVGKFLRFDQQAVEAWIAANTRPAQAS